MKFRYTIEEIGKNGSRDVVTRDFDQSEVIIGRGATADILLESRFVSLAHAKFSLPGNSLVVEDLGSLSGVLVNGDISGRTELKSGDSVQVGDVSFVVTFDGGVWGVIEHREEKEKEELDVTVDKQLKAVQLDKQLPRFTMISVVLSILIFFLFMIYPLFTSNKDSWNSGPISNNHHMIAENCDSCHGDPFTAVADEKCMACHNMADHAPAFAPALLEKHKNLKMRCAECHMEHNSENLILRTSALCINCHADLKQAYPDAIRQNVPNFDKHPEFSVIIQPPIPGGAYTRARLDEPDKLRDNSNVKLNHEKHLITLRGPKGDKVKLDCRDCHMPSPDLKTIEPISYEKHCQSCHGLEFDDRLKGRQVPHGEPDVVYKALYAEYAKLTLSNEAADRPAQEAISIRTRPGAPAASVAAQPAQTEDFKREFVEKSAREAERVLFSRTACFLCHRVNQKEISPQDAFIQQVSRFEVLQPDIPTRWMEDSIFSHRAHEEVQCDACHEGVRTSSKTTQILLPKVESCWDCHAEVQGHQKIKSDCVMCHSFHDQKVTASEKKRTLEEIIGKKKPE